jgi:hypothetical protein
MRSPPFHTQGGNPIKERRHVEERTPAVHSPEDPLTVMLRQGAQPLFGQAVEAAVIEFLTCKNFEFF